MAQKFAMRMSRHVVRWLFVAQAFALSISVYSAEVCRGYTDEQSGRNRRRVSTKSFNDKV
jgi:hypothetical protein